MIESGHGRGRRLQVQGPSAPYVVLDVFTDQPHHGNPLAVFTDAGSIPEAQFQVLARELHLSETAFLLPPRRDGDCRLRIFTPLVELPFAGHPVLGAAFVAADMLETDLVRLETAQAMVTVSLRRQANVVVFGRMTQPLPTWRPYPRAEALLASLGVASTTLPVEEYHNGPHHVYVGIASPEQLSQLRPDLTALAALGEIGVGCFAQTPYGWKSRNFAPGLGVPEDPATGSAAGPLAVHLARHGRIPFGHEIVIHQGAEINRPSTLYACATGTRERLDRVEVAGEAVLVAKGHFRVA